MKIRSETVQKLWKKIHFQLQIDQNCDHIALEDYHIFIPSNYFIVLFGKDSFYIDTCIVESPSHLLVVV